MPACAPFLGAVVGVMAYQLLIGYHLEGDIQETKRKEEEEKKEEETFRLSNISSNKDA